MMTATAAAATGATTPAFRKPAPLPVGLAPAGVVVGITGRGATVDVGATVAEEVTGMLEMRVVVAAVGRGPVGTGPSPWMRK